MTMQLFDVYAEEGSVVVFTAEADDGHHYLVAVDPEMARPLEDAIAAGASPACEVEASQIVAEVR
jgi:hypothetical protein